MMGMDDILAKKRLILAIVAMLSLVGTIMWLTMIRQEDPTMPNFWGMIVIPYHGADAVTIERLILDPMEDALAEVPEIKRLDASAFDEMVVLNIELRGDVADFDLVWDDVREAMAEAKRSFPEGAGVPVLDDEMQDQDAVVLAVTGSSDIMALHDAAKRIEDHFLRVGQVSKAHLIANPYEQITIDLDDTVANRMGLTVNDLAMRLHYRNQILPGGSLKVGEKTVRLRPLAEFADLEEIKSTPVLLPSGNSIPLSAIARVHQGPAEPAPSRMRFNSEMSVGIAIVPVAGINLVQFGDLIRDHITTVQQMVAPLSVKVVTFQPDRTKVRIGELSKSLIYGVLIVAGVLILAMGFRLGLLVASIVPLVTMTSLALFAWGDGVLHQISIAALVLSLGMLVDNAIVMAESIQYRLDAGEGGRHAAVGAVKELYVPLAAATLTTLAAFVPMLIAKGPTAMFTRTLPVMIMLTLSVSYFYAIFVTPILGELFLKEQKGKKAMGTEVWGRKIGGFAAGRPLIVLGVAFALVAVSFMSAARVRQQFFPTSDRNQFSIDLKLTEGAHLDATDKASRLIENALLAKPTVTKVASFMGRSAPQFYYNIISVPFSPHFAQLIVETVHKEDIEPLLAFIRNEIKPRLPDAEIVARKLEQGPPVGAPVEIRLFGEDFETLHQTAVEIAHKLKAIPGSADVRHDLGPGAPTIEFEIDDAEAGRYGLTRADVAQAVYGRTRGIPVGQLYAGDDPIPILIRSSQGEQMPVDTLASISVPARDGRMIPLAQIAKLKSRWRPAAIKHKDARRIVTVSSQLAPGYTFSDILSRFKTDLAAMTIPQDIQVKFGGDQEGSGEANDALLKSVPMGVLMLLVVLLVEFNSFRRLSIILITIPLAAAGVIPGLLISNQPFGFTSLLGVIALIGIVVNNAIVLLDVVEERRQKGIWVKDALADAVGRRTRPILLTMATTIAGLLPLAFSSSTLWPPLAWAMISGLLASTVLTLAVVPALYRVLFLKDKRRLFVVAGKMSKVASLIWIVSIVARPVQAGPDVLSLEEAMKRAEERPALKSARYQVDASEKVLEAEKRAAYFPTLTSQAAYIVRDRDVDMVVDIPGVMKVESSIGDKRHLAATVAVVQPLFDPTRHLHNIAAAEDDLGAACQVAKRKKQELAAEAGAAYLNILTVDAHIMTTKAYTESLDARLSEMRKMMDVGRVLEADMLKVLLVSQRAENQLETLERLRRVAEEDLVRVINGQGRVEVAPVQDWWEKAPPSETAAQAIAWEKRPDLQAMKMTISGLAKKRAGVKAGALPSVSAVGKWLHDDGLSGYSEDSWFEGSVNVTWTPFAGGVRMSKTSELTDRLNSLKQDLAEIQRGIALEVQSRITAIRNKKGEYGVEKRGIEMAAETLRVEQARHQEGRATTNDLLDAEAQLRERKTAFEVARIDIVRAWIDLWLSMGAEPFTFTF